MKRSFKKRNALLIFIGFFLFVVIYNNQTVTVNQQDKQYLQLFLNDWNIHQTPKEVHQSFESEVSFISRVQDSVIAQVHHQNVPHQDFGNVAYYYSDKKGQCYDRAVLLEKFFTYYHFPFRHLYVYFNDNGIGPTKLDFFKKSLTSHAITEVKTSKGWLIVGCNSNWLGLDSSGNPMTIAELRKHIVSNTLYLKKPATMGQPSFWTLHNDFRFIYGIYSRHGDFFNHTNQNLSAASVAPSSFHVLPDYNLRMLFYNLFN
jgi:hypothetical protein